MLKNLKLLMLALLMVLGISACIHPTKRVQLDDCYELAADAMLIRTKCPGLMRDFMIANASDDSYAMGSCLDHVVENLKTGERVHFNEVIYQFQGATGSCWRVFADLPNRRDINVVEIPACFPGFATPSGWTTVEDGVVEVNPERLRRCSE